MVHSQGVAVPSAVIHRIHDLLFTYDLFIINRKL